MSYIDRKPDQAMFVKLVNLPMCSHSTSFVAENLNHDVFDIFI